MCWISPSLITSPLPCNQWYHLLVIPIYLVSNLAMLSMGFDGDDNNLLGHVQIMILHTFLILLGGQLLEVLARSVFNGGTIKECAMRITGAALLSSALFGLTYFAYVGTSNDGLVFVGRPRWWTLDQYT